MCSKVFLETGSVNEALVKVLVMSNAIILDIKQSILETFDIYAFTLAFLVGTASTISWQKKENLQKDFTQTAL